MSLRKKIVVGLFIGFVAIQFIQPSRNQNAQLLSTDIKQVYPVPGMVLAVFQNSCYDCHSNNTGYPWYSFIQPAGWLMSSHIKNGKANLNFSEFGVYSNRKQQSKLQAIANSIKDKTMPLSSYTMLHRNAKLSKNDKMLLLDWIKTTTDSISLKGYKITDK